MTVQELIDKLPEELKPYAQTYFDFIVAQSSDILTEWVNAVAAGDWRAAYKMLVSKMSTQQLIDELQLQRKVQAQLQAQGQANTEVQQALIASLLKALISMLVAAVQ